MTKCYTNGSKIPRSKFWLVQFSSVGKIIDLKVCREYSSKTRSTKVLIEPIGASCTFPIFNRQPNLNVVPFYQSVNKFYKIDGVSLSARRIANLRITCMLRIQNNVPSSSFKKLSSFQEETCSSNCPSDKAVDILSIKSRNRHNLKLRGEYNDYSF
jgi:hypothetical protein